MTATNWLVQAGTNMKYLTLSVPPVTTPSTATISATANGVTKAAMLTIIPATLQGLAFSPNPVTGGTTVTGTIFLGGVSAAGGTVVSVTSSVPGTAAVPASVTVPAGTKSTTFSIRTAPVTAQQTVLITMKQGTATVSGKLVINP
jgi:hypothetical protein